jgi:rare lipoprotein A
MSGFVGFRVGGAQGLKRIGAVAALAVALAVSVQTAAEAKTPGRTYCFNGICHRVHTIPEMVGLVGRDQTFETSFYDDCRRDRYNPCGLTSSGEAYRPGDADSAASPIYPDGTILLVRNPTNGAAAVVRVNNAGPYWRRRQLDVSRATAEKLGFAGRGVANLEVRVMTAPSLADATYKKNRRYARVPGPIGAFASLDDARGGMMVAMALDALSSSVLAPIAGKMLVAAKSASPQIASALHVGLHNKLAVADGIVAESVSTNAEKGLTPAEGLKAAARRLYRIEQAPRRTAPSSFMADLPLMPAIARRRG